MALDSWLILLLPAPAQPEWNCTPHEYGQEDENHSFLNSSSRDTVFHMETHTASISHTLPLRVAEAKFLSVTERSGVPFFTQSSLPEGLYPGMTG